MAVVAAGQWPTAVQRSRSQPMACRIRVLYGFRSGGRAVRLEAAD